MLASTMTRGPALMLTVLLVACGGDDTGASASGTDATGSTSTPTTSSTGSTGTATGSTTGGGSTGGTAGATGSTGTGSSDGTGTTGSGSTGSSGGTGGSGGTGSAGTTGTTGGAMVGLAITNLMVFQDCMPIVAPDPMGASWTLEVTNDGASAVSGTVDAARLLDQADQELGTIGFSPAAIPSVNPTQTVPVAMSKTASSLSPANGCSTAPCSSTVKLELDVTVGGQPQSVQASTTVDCVF